MKCDTLLNRVAEKSGYSREETQQFYQAMVSVFAETLGQGETMECLPEWGRFIPKLRDNSGRQKNSPRREKKPHYYIQFRPGKEFEDYLCSCLETEDDQGREQK